MAPTDVEWLPPRELTPQPPPTALKRAFERSQLDAKTLAETEAKAKREADERAAQAQREADASAVVNAGAGQHADPTASGAMAGVSGPEEAKPAPKIKKYLVRWRLDKDDQASHIHCSWEEVRVVFGIFTRLPTLMNSH